MRTIIVVGGNIPDFEFTRKKPPSGLYTNEEIDRMNPDRLTGKNREELLRIKKRLADTIDWLDPDYDCDVDSPEWKQWERRLDRLYAMDDAIDELLEEDDPEDDYDTEE